MLPHMDGVEGCMTDPDAAWWAKLRRAERHRGTLVDLVEEFRASDPYTLVTEEETSPERIRSRRRVRRGG
jgi:hypothetical protein